MKFGGEQGVNVMENEKGGRGKGGIINGRFYTPSIQHTPYIYTGLFLLFPTWSIMLKLGFFLQPG